MNRRPAAVVVFAVLGVLASWRLATGQGGGGWMVVPPAPTVGDTVWLTRLVTADPGWRVRAGRLDPAQDLEPLGEAVVLRAQGGWLVRYPVVLWTPGRHELALPPVWRLGPDGQADSVLGGVAAVQVRSVLPSPDSARRSEPKPALPEIGRSENSALPVLGAGVIAGLSLTAGVLLRRRRPKRLPAPAPIRGEPEVADARWLAAGEPKAVAARAAARLRAVVAGVVPEAHAALSTEECLAIVAARAPKEGAPLRELREVLSALDQVGFATAHGADVGVLAERARALAAALRR